MYFHPDLTNLPFTLQFQTLCCTKYCISTQGEIFYTTLFVKQHQGLWR